MAKFDGKVALVTGGGTGIGRGITEHLVAEGARVLIAARRAEKLKEVAALAPDKISYSLMDLTSRKQRHQTLQTCIERFGRLDFLINNTADQPHKPFLEQTEDEIDRVVHTNLASTINMCHRAMPLLQKTGGSIVNISSASGRYVTVPSQHLVSYCATKAGINQFTRALAAEVGPLGVRANAVAPGFTRAEVSMREVDRQGIADVLCGMTAMGRIGEPIDIARLVSFLVSEEAGWITGQIIDASGGFQLGGG